MIFSYEIERQVLSGLIQKPEIYEEISSFISEQDFFSEDSSVNQTIYRVIKTAIENGESLNDVLISERVKDLGISFEDNIDILDYIKSLSIKILTEETSINSAKDLKKISVRRDIQKNCTRISKKMDSLDPSFSLSEIIDSADNIYNNHLNYYDNGDAYPSNIFKDMEQIIEGIADNPIDPGPMGPLKRLNQLYGSLLRPGNITTIVARSGVGKTQFVMDFCTKVSKLYDIPVLHLDNGEMSRDEILMRQCASLSGISLNLLESGKWRACGKETVKRVRDVWKEISGYKFYYYNVGGLSVDKIINVIKRFYYSKIKRGNKLILSFDYIKTTSEKSDNNKSEWQVVGEMVDKFKRLVQKDILFEDDPQIAMMTSVQSNRYGITNNRNSNAIIDDESIISLSDRIIQFSSHLFHLRKKTTDELVEEDGFGTHKLVCFKNRHLGEDIQRAIQPVRMPDGDFKQNYLNLSFDNFNITEIGDLNDFVDGALTVDINASETQEDLAL